jgi:2'-5' RNA ligase
VSERDDQEREQQNGAPREPRHRVFYALWPDTATSTAIVRATRRAVRLSGGAPMAKDRLHITVAFLGSLTAEELERARSVMPISVGAFDLTLDMLGIWPGSRTLWLAGRGVPQALNALEQRLWEALEPHGFEREERIYRPHVTLARRARAVEAAVDPVVWHAEDVVLAESLSVPRGVHYEVLERWPL